MHEVGETDLLAGPVTARVRWSVLGQIGVSVDGVELSLPPQARFVLGHLLRRPGQAVRVEQLCRGGADGADDRAIAAARVAVSRLRQAVAGVSEITATSQGYVLDVDPQSVDHVAFDKAVRDARATEWPATAKHLLDRALATWADPPFGEWSGEDAFALDAHALEELHRGAVDQWCSLVTQTGLHADELDRLERATLAEPLREQRWVALMLAHYRSGNQTEAIRTYERVRELLADQVGLEPGDALRTMLRRVLDQDTSLDWRPQRLKSRPSPFTSLDTATVVIGREDDLLDIVSLLERHRVVTIVGLGGIGKSALAGEVARAIDRSAWVAPLADVHDRGRALRTIARSMGLSNRIPDAALPAAVGEHLQSVAGLLVLDNCEHLEAEITEIVRGLTTVAPDARILATSRVELVISGGVAHHLGPLATGTAAAPGPAAMIVADHAAIGRSAMAARWSEIESLCARAEGIPLALQLLGSSSSAQNDGAVLDAVTHAVRSAIEALPVESRSLVYTLAALPGGTRVEFLARVAGLTDDEVRRALGFAVRGSLVVQRGGTDAAMTRVIEPARDVLGPQASTDDGLIRSVRDVVLALAIEARPSLIDRMDGHVGTLLDDEHDTIAWLLPRVADDDRLVLASVLAPIWRAAGRTEYGARVLAELEPIARRADPLVAARYWVMRGQILPTPANRVAFLTEIEAAVEVASEHGVVDLELRARGELALALGWTGRFDEALAQTEVLRERCPAGNDWAKLSVEALLALGQAIIGDPLRASDSIFEVGRQHAAAGDVDEWLWATASAASFAREGNDFERVRRALASVDGHEPDRFTRFSHALLRYERALLAVHEGASDIGPRFFDALGALTEDAEPRHVGICRRDLGMWRLANGDASGARDIAAGTRLLLHEDPRQAAVGLRAVADVLRSRGRTGDAELANAFADRLDTRTPIDDALQREDEDSAVGAIVRVLADLAGAGASASV